MPAFAPIPLGQRIPSSLHAVSCSLPRMSDVRGYEEKNPEVVKQMTSGYPRFVVHPFLQQLAGELARAHGCVGQKIWLTSSATMARRLAQHLGVANVTSITDAGIHAVAHADVAEISARAKTFLQNVGGFLSSRAAEDALVERGVLPSAAKEELFTADPIERVRDGLRPAFPDTDPRELLIANCGMNAVDAAFRAISELASTEGRTVWIQLGWLYLDTIALLQKFTAGSSAYVHLENVFDLGALERVLEGNRDRVAGIVAEVPTNPLMQTPDVAALAALARRHGARLILDPSMTSAYNLDLLRHADVVASSLTKYTASAGDLTAGLVVVNPAMKDAAVLRRSIEAKIEPLYGRDAARLAAQIGRTPEVLAKIHASVPKVVDFLSHHPGVREVYWALHPASKENYLRVARRPDAVGAMITFTLRGSLETFYDRLRLPKGPSFGMETTLICPFMYLAHYDLVTTEAGRDELARSGLDPDLLRLSVGTEPVDEIIAALREALG